MMNSEFRYFIFAHTERHCRTNRRPLEGGAGAQRLKGLSSEIHAYILIYLLIPNSEFRIHN